MAKGKVTKIVDTPLARIIARRQLRHRGVALWAGISPQLLSAILHGNRRATPDVAKRLADALDVDLEMLFPELRRGDADTDAA